MPIFDMHCDVLSKYLVDDQLNFIDNTLLDVNLTRMKQSNYGVQAFAIYIPEEMNKSNIHHVWRSIELFHRKILCHSELKLIRNANDLVEARNKGQIGAILTLEGADALGGDFTLLHMLFHLGLRSIGVTWNYANWAADGVREPRQGGFTLKGKQFIKECDQLGITLDVSHLTQKGFWELIELSERPNIASHSNCKELCKNERNLTKEQIQAIIHKNGVVGLTFVPSFLSDNGKISAVQLLRHLDYICSLGGEKHVGFGSDFDGIDVKVDGLEHAGCYSELIELLCKYYNDEMVNGFICENWHHFFLRNLPRDQSKICINTI